jgi:Ca-activated chloride channel family protein
MVFRYILLLTVLLLPVAAISQRRMPGFQARQPVESDMILASSDDHVVVNADLVTFRATVMDDHGKYVLGLDKSSFTVRDNGVPQEITTFTDEDAPVSIAVLFDTSGSMTGTKIAQAKEALAGFIQTSHPRDEFFLISFDSYPHLLLDHSRDGDTLLKKFTYLETGGNTALYDALNLGLEAVSRGAYTKRAILLITDGEDNASRYTLKEVQRKLQESDISIYSIGIRDFLITPQGMMADKDLRRLASMSGGATFFPSSSNQMAEAFEQIALELRHQYSIGYRPANFVPDGKWHRLKIQVEKAEGERRRIVRSREGYYAAPTAR